MLLTTKSIDHHHSTEKSRLQLSLLCYELSVILSNRQQWSSEIIVQAKDRLLVLLCAAWFWRSVSLEFLDKELTAAPEHIPQLPEGATTLQGSRAVLYTHTHWLHTYTPPHLHLDIYTATHSVTYSRSCTQDTIPTDITNTHTHTSIHKRTKQTKINVQTSHANIPTDLLKACQASLRFFNNWPPPTGLQSAFLSFFFFCN